MQQAEIDREQEQFKQDLKEVKAEIASLAKRRDALAQEYARSSPLKQQLSRYFGFGASRKLEWINFKLKFKQEQLAALVIHSEEGMNEGTPQGSFAPPPSVTEIIQEKLKQMVSAKPAEPEPDIRRVYQRLNVTEQEARP